MLHFVAFFGHKPCMPFVHSILECGRNFIFFFTEVTHYTSEWWHNWIGLCSVLRPLQHSIGYMGDGFYRSKDPTKVSKVSKSKYNVDLYSASRFKKNL